MREPGNQGLYSYTKEERACGLTETIGGAPPKTRDYNGGMPGTFAAAKIR